MLNNGIPGTMLSSKVDLTNCAIQKVNKQVEGKIRNFKLVKNKQVGKNKGTAKKWRDKGGCLYQQIY